MAQDELTAGTSSGQQTDTQNPQTAGQAGNTGAQSSSLQPGTATNLLTSPNGVSLNNTPLATLSLDPSQNTSSSSTLVPPNPAPHHLKPALLIFPGVLVLLALILFWLTTRQAKSTTI
ncbi:MAG: hypothetical protein NVS1B10_02500 [Candidatus Saccharimonadales bacterium]